MDSDRSSLERTLRWAEVAGFTAAISTVLYLESSRNPEFLKNPVTLFAPSPDPETAWVSVVLLIAPFVWWLSRRRAVPISEQSVVEQQPPPSPPAARPRDFVAAWLSALVLSLFHVLLVHTVSISFRGMPPSYHDEYSYLFQAQTFLAGKLYFTTHPLAEFFNQMHVLNDNGVFASRYFPGVGLWLAPWVALDHPEWGHYLAGGLIVLCAYWIGWELAKALNRTSEAPSKVMRYSIASAAALFCAISPATLVFGNLLLSHHPTMLGLAVFLLCYLRALPSTRLLWPLVGGVALSFAMLCRPLTAFGFAVPFGIHLAILLWRGQLKRPCARLAAALLPVIGGLGLLAGYNTALTGHPLQSPYGLYTRIYTPNHVYGFYNVTRGRSVTSSKVLDNYNNWAEDLTPRRAVTLAVRRMSASAVWSIGRVSLAAFIGAFLVFLPWLPVEWKLLVFASIGVHAVYFPFGFEGIFNVSYVFESVPVLCMLAAGIFVWIGRQWLIRGLWARFVWSLVFLAIAFSGPMAQLIDGITEVRFARRYYAAFEHRLQSAGLKAPAIVLIQPDPTDRHRDLVTNAPSLSGPILRARFDTSLPIPALLDMYAERNIWLYDARTDTLAALGAESLH